MALHYSSGAGILYDKETKQSILKLDYQLIETDPTKYTRKKWWGEFNCRIKIEKSGIYRMEMEDGRSGDCVVWSQSEAGQVNNSQYSYHFNGRSKIGKDKR
jgi:hypothetical protein